MNDFAKPKLMADKAHGAVDKAADAVQDGIDSVERAAYSAGSSIDKLASKADTALRSDSAPVFEKVTDQAHKLIQQGREAVHDTTHRVREKASDLSDAAIMYTKDEPVKAMLISAAAGALFISVLAMLTRPSR